LKEHILVHQFPQSANKAIVYAQFVGVFRNMVVFSDPSVDVDIQNIVEISESFGIELIVAVNIVQITVVILVEILVSIKNVCRLLGFDGVCAGLSARDPHK
jgi:hypothetical protein